MHDEPSLTRHLILIRTLSARRSGATVKELARESGVTEKTIRRDFNRLKQCGFPLVESTGDHGRKTWRVTNDGKLPPLVFAVDEAVVLYLARQLLEPLAGTCLWEAAHRAMRKVRATLGESAIEYLDRFPKLFHSTTSGFGDYSSKAGIIDALTLASEDRKAVHITYQSQQATEPATRDVYPYGWSGIKARSTWLPSPPSTTESAITRSTGSRRSKSARSCFSGQPISTSPEHLAGSFGIYDGDEDVTVVVKFLPAAARYVRESNWHTSQVSDYASATAACSPGSSFPRPSRSRAGCSASGPMPIVLEPDELRGSDRPGAGANDQALPRSTINNVRGFSPMIADPPDPIPSAIATLHSHAQVRE